MYSNITRQDGEICTHCATKKFFTNGLLGFLGLLALITIFILSLKYGEQLFGNEGMDTFMMIFFFVGGCLGLYFALSFGNYFEKYISVIYKKSKNYGDNLSKIFVELLRDNDIKQMGATILTTKQYKDMKKNN